jgi:hypothetical protein
LRRQKSWGPLGTAEPIGESGGVSGRAKTNCDGNNPVRGAAMIEMIGTYSSIIQPNSHIGHHTRKFIHRRIDIYNVHLGVSYVAVVVGG